jgi:hypothetical protein
MSHHHLHKKKTLHGVIQKIKFTRGKPNKKTLPRVIEKKKLHGVKQNTPTLQRVNVHLP